MGNDRLTQMHNELRLIIFNSHQRYQNASDALALGLFGESREEKRLALQLHNIRMESIVNEDIENFLSIIDSLKKPEEAPVLFMKNTIPNNVLSTRLMHVQVLVDTGINCPDALNVDYFIALKDLVAEARNCISS